MLLSADSASTIFAALIGDNLIGNKPELGQNARVRGQFASSYKTRVLPDFLSLVDDPTLAALDGTALLGHYEVDDEGVKAQRVPLVEKGMLVNFLVGRQPIRDFPSSNGHGRASLPLSWPTPALGNLVVQFQRCCCSRGTEEEIDRYLQGTWPGIWLLRQDDGRGSRAALALSRLDAGWPRGTGARRIVRRS